MSSEQRKTGATRVLWPHYVRLQFMSMLKECTSVWPSHTPLQAHFSSPHQLMGKQDEGEQECTTEFKNISFVFGIPTDVRNTIQT